MAIPPSGNPGQVSPPEDGGAGVNSVFNGQEQVPLSAAFQKCYGKKKKVQVEKNSMYEKTRSVYRLSE